MRPFKFTIYSSFLNFIIKKASPCGFLTFVDKKLGGMYSESQSLFYPSDQKRLETIKSFELFSHAGNRAAGSTTSLGFGVRDKLSEALISLELKVTVKFQNKNSLDQMEIHFLN